jgi:hypothetical protein
MHYHLSFLDDDRHVQVFALVDAGKTRAEAAEELGSEQELEPTLDQMIGFCLAGAEHARQARRAVPTSPVVSGSAITKAFTTHGATR